MITRVGESPFIFKSTYKDELMPKKEKTIQIQVFFNDAWHALVNLTAKVKKGVPDWSKITAVTVKDPNEQWPNAPQPTRQVEL